MIRRLNFVLKEINVATEPVPEATIRRMAEKLQPLTEAEGFDRIEHVHVVFASP